MQNNPTPPFAFVIMPFSKELDDAYRLGIKSSADECEVRAERLDEQIFSEGMLDRIYRQIDIADFIIADLSDRNANVFYELGYAHAKNKICILITKDAADIPFDLKHRRHIVYGGSISYLKSELIKNIEWAKKEAKSKEKRKILVTVKSPTGDLTTTEQTAEATITFSFDLHNKADQTSPEIFAIYLYTGNQWKVIQDARECHFSEADIAPYKYRYLISPPSHKIGANGLSHLKVKASRTLAMAWKGDEIKDEYTVRGRGVLRLETSDGNYDHEFDFNLELTEIPF